MHCQESWVVSLSVLPLRYFCIYCSRSHYGNEAWRAWLFHELPAVSETMVCSIAVRRMLWSRPKRLQKLSPFTCPTFVGI